MGSWTGVSDLTSSWQSMEDTCRFGRGGGYSAADIAASVRSYLRAVKFGLHRRNRSINILLILCLGFGPNVIGARSMLAMLLSRADDDQ